jgi:hypothetical protein
MPSLKLAAILTFALTTSAFAAETAPPVGPAAPSPADAVAAKAAKAEDAAKQKLVCAVEQPTGSRVAKRVCRTVAQIDHERTAAQRTRENLRGVEPVPAGDTSQ